jgi:phenylalanyl-tRNA synthetase alpha chain
MREEIINIKNEAIAQITEAKEVSELETFKINYLGRNGKINDLLKGIKDVSAEDRKDIGILLNEAKQTIASLIVEQENKLRENTREWFDPTVPGIEPKTGHLHLVTQAIREISNIFEGLGFVRSRYPEVEWDYFAFTALNMPTEHAARDEWETFFMDYPENKKYGRMVLTPHTSSGQIREMLRVKTPPIRMINIAKCYRRQMDVSHNQMFHQFEGLVIDKGISIVNLKGTLDYFAKNFFGEERVTRLRPYHFQFTEPSFEVDISCGLCGGKGCKLCKSGWLELGGAGMVHPNVLKECGIDPKKYTGFAFGWGVERTFMMKSGLKIDDIRKLYGSDVRFLKQF